MAKKSGLIGLVLVLGMQFDVGVGALDCAAQLTLTVKFNDLDIPSTFQSDRIAAGLCAGTYGLVVSSSGEPSYVLRKRDSDSENRVWMNTTFAKIEDFGVWRWTITVELDEGQQEILQLGTTVNIYPSKPVLYYCPQATAYQPQTWYFIRDFLFAEMVTTFKSSSIPLTNSPTSAPTTPPSTRPSRAPSTTPTQLPTSNPTKDPTLSPSVSPSPLPSSHPIRAPTIAPTSPSPTQTPSTVPTSLLTTPPSNSPTRTPSDSPTMSPTARDTTLVPSTSPSVTNNNIPNTSPPTDSPTIFVTFSSPPSLSPTLVGTSEKSSQGDDSIALPIALVAVFVIVIAIVVVVVVMYRRNHRKNNHENVDLTTDTNDGYSQHATPLAINPISMMFDDSDGVVDTNMYRRDSHVINEGDVMFSVPLDGSEMSDSVDGDVGHSGV
eukprot:m.110422 g.110422  ORF g.110422 m.110422 type:complete len:435 (-) comp28038_c0_seq1:51-1355(-)